MAEERNTVKQPNIPPKPQPATIERVQESYNPLKDAKTKNK